MVVGENPLRGIGTDEGRVFRHPRGLVDEFVPLGDVPALAEPGFDPEPEEARDVGGFGPVPRDEQEVAAPELGDALALPEDGGERVLERREVRRVGAVRDG